MRTILKGATDQSVVIRIIDATDGTPETGVLAATSGLDLQYRREGAVAVALTEADLSALNDAHSDGGLLHIGGGYYRVDLPDAAVASGSDGVLVFGTVTGMVVIGAYLHLVAYDPENAASLGLSRIDTPLSNLETDTQDIQARLPAALTADGNIKADALRVGGTVQTGGDLSAQIDAVDNFVDTEVAAIKTVVDAIQVDTDDIQTRLPAALTADGNMKADTLRVGGTVQTAGDLAALVTAVDDFVDTEVAAILAAVDTEVGAIKTKTDSLTFTTANQVDATTVTNSDKTGYRLSATGVDDVFDEATSGHTTAGTYGDKLGAHIAAVGKLVVDTGSTTTAVVFKTVDGAAASATDDFYNGRVIVFTSGALALQATSITDYVGATKTATVVALTGAPANNVTGVIV